MVGTAQSQNENVRERGMVLKRIISNFEIIEINSKFGSTLFSDRRIDPPLVKMFIENLVAGCSTAHHVE